MNPLGVKLGLGMGCKRDRAIQKEPNTRLLNSESNFESLNVLTALAKILDQFAATKSFKQRE